MTLEATTREALVNAWCALFIDVLREDVDGRDQPRDDDAVERAVEETAAERPSSEAA